MLSVYSTCEQPSTALLPLVYTWNDPEQPLPVRLVRVPPRMRGTGTALDAPPYYPTGPVDRPFDFCGHVRRLCESMVARCDLLKHIDVSRLLFAMTQARSGRSHGLQARVTPLRLRDGVLVRQRRGVPYQVQRYFVNGREMLYLVTFCLPRFLNQGFDDKFVTLFHELYHISPRFDGDFRRHEGRYRLHTHSQRCYDQHMAALAREYLSGGPDFTLHDFLRLNFAQLQHRHQGVAGIVVPRPKVIPLLG